MIDNAESARRRRWARRVGAVAALVALTGWSIVRTTRPPAPLPANVPDTLFSAARALHLDSIIAQRPRPFGSTEHARVRDELVAQLTALGLAPEVQRVRATGTRYHLSGEVENVLAHVPGRVPSGAAVLLVAHYDGVRAGPAAADDGAGVAAVLEAVRAIRARRRPLAHDVIVLFTDREESGLLGAAAFVHDHPWAKDVAFIVNLEARGTRGRAMMFETGPGNLDAVRVLRRAGSVTTGSVFTTLYHMLPNDTDLSELAALGRPALNFAFLDGAQWYHSPFDDLAHLDAGSVQHGGQQMLTVATTVADGTLPRPKTSDAVFFDFPIAKIVIYPVWMTIPLLIAAIALVAISRRAWRIGVLVWLLLAAVTTIAAPPTSYLFVWPVLFAAAAARSGSPVAEWIALAFTLLLLGGFVYGVAVILLGANVLGVVVVVAFTLLVAWLFAPTLARALGLRRSGEADAAR